MGRVTGIVEATKEAVDGLDLGLPDQQVQAIADAVAAKLLGGPAGTLTEDDVQAIADAVAGRLLDIPLGTVMSRLARADSARARTTSMGASVPASSCCRFS